MDEEIEYSLHDEIAELTAELAVLSEALGIISEIDDYHQALVYDTLQSLGYYEDDEHENEMEGALS